MSSTARAPGRVGSEIRSGSCARLPHGLAVGSETSCLAVGKSLLGLGHHRPGLTWAIGIACRLNPAGVLVSPGPGASPTCAPSALQPARPSHAQGFPPWERDRLSA